MMERYRVTAGRIRQEPAALEHLVARSKRAMGRAREHPAHQDLFLDSVAMNLHDLLTGLEGAFHQIAAVVDEMVPSNHNWHEELLRQMAEKRPQVRRAVISAKTLEALDDYMRFRHVVRNIYTFEFDSDRVGRLIDALDGAFNQVR